MLEIKDESEIILLGKLISYVKFKSIDDESAFISCSSSINSLSDKVVSELKSLNLGGKNAPNSLHLKNYEHIRKTVVEKLGNHPSWNDIDLEVKKKLVINAVYPYEVEESDIDDIINSVKPS